VHKLIFALLLSIVVTLPAYAKQPVPFKGNRTVTVMTRNLYVGFDLAPVTAAVVSNNIPQLLLAVKNAVDTLNATNFPERAEALAAEIAAKQPDLVGLQEVTLIRSQFPPDFSPTPNATTIEFDYLQILLDALAARGLSYAPVVTVTDSDVEVPGLLPNFACCKEYRVTDHDVLLARTDLGTNDLKLSNPQAGNFAAFVPLGSSRLLRGWVAVDVKIRGKSFRLISTHLEAISAAAQVAQGNEILSGPAATPLPVVLVCDCNSPADGTGSATYGNLIAAGFDDAWDVAFPGNPGLTCCHDELLLEPVASFTDRIDLVLFRGDFEVTGADLVGENPADRTPSGLWPSDHAGVAATLTFRK
jgi:endonuclease/exonuclease/phosphatase family metal-dependent hydrolase